MTARETDGPAPAADAGARAAVYGPRGPAVDAAVGFGLCMVTLVRGLRDEPIPQLSPEALAVVLVAGAALLLRRRWPPAALALAVASGVLAMPVALRESAADLVLGLGLLAVAGGRTLPGHRPGPRVPGPRAMAAALRRGWRMPALALAAAGAVVVVPADIKESAAVAILLTAYAVGLTSGRTAVLFSATVAAGAVALGATLIAPESWTGPDTPVPLIATALVGAAVGEAVRSRRELLVASEERARRAEQVLEEEARRRVVEERLRIAREVHDLVAHHIAVVSMQAGVAAHHLREQADPPADVMTAIGHVRTAARTVLGELGTLVSVLRGDDDPAAPVEPTPTLTDLDTLLESLRTAGMQVETRISGEPGRLPPSAELTAYRVIQECLTNARKHGDGTARLALEYTADRLVIEVRNPCPPPAPAAATGTGHGLVGMRERVAAVGGSLRAGRTGGGEFVVTVRLPTTRENKQ